MYAIVEIAGQQFKVEKDQRVFVHRLATEEGKTVSFDNVLLIGDGDTITLGAPAIDGALVGAKVLSHLKGDKVIVFKKKRRKGYRVKNGHRQALTEIVIESIVASGAVKATKDESKGGKKAEKTEKAKPAKAEKAAPVKEAKKAEPKKAAKKEVEEVNTEINIDKVLESVGKAKKTDADDLKLINGIGPVYEEKLNELGIFTFEQISKLK
ncbi:MAG: 50S ribosomal protein L21, partial [Gelidibacter sp.]